MRTGIPVVLVVSVLALFGCTATVVVTATPEAEVPIQADTTPTASSDVPTESQEQIDILATVGPILTRTPVPGYTPIPSPTPLIVPLPAEVTDGVRAVAACTGKPEAYWLEHGVPVLDAELVQCINEYLGAN